MNLDDLRDFYTRESAGEPLDPTLTTDIATLRESGQLPPAGYEWKGRDSPRPLRNNNPANIKVGGLTRSAAGLVGTDPAQDGGEFGIFGTPEHGFAAALNLLGSDRYAALPLEQAMRTWSGKGYGAEVAADLDLPGDVPISSLDPTARMNLMLAMAKREGYPIEQIDLGKVAGFLGGAAPAPTEAAPSVAPAESPVAPEGFQNPLAALGETVGAMGSRMLQGARDVGGAMRLGKGEDPSVLAALGRAPGVAGSIAQAVEPLALGPGLTAAEIGAGTLARTLGSHSPVSPSTAETLTAFAPVGANLVRGGARILSPSLRRLAANEAAMAQQGVANVGAGIGQAGQLAERTAAGEAAQGAAEGIGHRLQRATTEPAFITPSPTTKQIVAGKEVRMTGPTRRRSLTEADYTADSLALRRHNERAAQTAVNFDRAVTQKLRGVGPHDTATKLAESPDLLNALRLHADPEEFAIIQRAVEAGQNLSKLPFDADEMAKVSALVTNPSRPSILGGLTRWGAVGAGGGAGLGALMAGSISGGVPGVAGYYLARTALRSLDAVVSSRSGQALLRRLGGFQPGSREAMQTLAVLGGRLAGPVEIEKRD